jgi:hypothetical protein
MRTITTPDFQVMTFEELTPEAKEKAIEQVRNSYYEHNDFCEWAIDDCYLLNPPYKEVEKLDSTLKDGILIKNNRVIYFSLDRDRCIDISNAMEVVSDDVFLEWLGVTERMIRDELVCFTIGKDTIEFEENHFDKDFTDRDLRILERAKDKFKDHCADILNSLEKEYDYRFTDEAIIEDIEANGFEFHADGRQF